MSDRTDTPRTDSLKEEWNQYFNYTDDKPNLRPWDLARQLERELTAVKEAYDTLTSLSKKP